MKRHSCLRRNPKTFNYEYRKIVPKSLREHFGKSEIKRSFGLKNYNTELLSLFYKTSLEVEQMIDEARESTMDNTPKNLQEPSVYGLRVCMTKFIDIQMTAIKSAASNEHIQSLIKVNDLNLILIGQGNAEVERKAKQSRDLELTKEHLSEDFKRVLAQYGYTLPTNHIQYNEALRAYRDIIERICNAATNLMHNGKDLTNYEGYKPELEPKAPTTHTQQYDTNISTFQSGARVRTVKTLGEALDAYKQDKMLSDSRKTLEKDLSENTTAINQFASTLNQGLNTPLTDIQTDDADEFRILLMQLPKARKLQAFSKGLGAEPLRVQVDLTKDADLETLSQATVKNKLKRASAIITHAVDKRWVDANVFQGVARRVGVDKNAKTSEEKTYSRTDLNKIFTGDIFVKRAGNNKLWRSSHGEATYWIPLIHYYTGARPEEIAQLYVKNLMEEEGVKYIHITNEEPDQSVKTGKRKTPIHPDLIKLGLYEYIKILDTNSRLFPELSATNEGKYSNKISASLGKRFRNHYDTDAKVAPLHGFRHTFRTIARRDNLKMPRGHVDKMLGHKGQDIGEHYGEYELTELHPVMCRFPSIDNIEELLADSPWAKH